MPVFFATTRWIRRTGPRVRLPLYARSRSRIATTRTKPNRSHLTSQQRRTCRGCNVIPVRLFPSPSDKNVSRISVTRVFTTPPYTDRCEKDTGTRRGQRNTTYVQRITYSHRTRTNPLCRWGGEREHTRPLVTPF